MTALVDRSGFRAVRALALVVAVAGLFDVALERALLPLVNHALRGLGDAPGASLAPRDARAPRAIVAGDVDLAPWRLALVLRDVTVRDGDGALLAELPAVDVGFDPVALLEHRLRGRLVLHAPRAYAVVDDASVVAWLRRLPVRWHSVAVDDGSAPVEVDGRVVAVAHINVKVDNVDNGDGVVGARFARVAARAFLDGKDVHCEGRFDPRAAAPSFAVRAVVADLVADVSAKDGRYFGFVRSLAGGGGSGADDAAFIAGVVGRATRLFDAR